MIYLIWGLINVGLFIFFIAVCFKATKLIREKIGLFASIVFVFGLLSFIGQSNNESDNKKQNSNQIKSWKYNSEDSLNSTESYLLDINLEKNLVSELNLGIKYVRIKESLENIPISAYSSMTGFISGTSWQPKSIIVKRTNANDKFKYFVAGVLEWKLLGMTVYLQSKDYKGYAIAK